MTGIRTASEREPVRRRPRERARDFMAGKGVWGRRSDGEKGEEEGSREREPKETALCRRKGQKGLGRADFKSSIVLLFRKVMSRGAFGAFFHTRAFFFAPPRLARARSPDVSPVISPFSFSSTPFLPVSPLHTSHSRPSTVPLPAILCFPLPLHSSTFHFLQYLFMKSPDILYSKSNRHPDVPCSN